MKFLSKLALYVMVLVAFTLTSCTATKEPAKPITAFTAKVTCNEQSYTISHSGNTLTTVTHNTPNTINGIAYTFKNSIMSVSYNNLTYTSSVSLPLDNTASEIYNALLEINSLNTYLKSTTNTTATYTTPTADVICNLTTGEIQQIIIKKNSNIYKFQYEI